MNKTAITRVDEGKPSAGYLLDLFVLLGGALLLRLAYGISHPLQGDELFHYLAAIGWIENGSPGIADGVYDRARAFIFLLKETMSIGGESVAVARLWPLLFSLAWIGVFYAWLRSKTCRWTALLAAGLLAAAPHSVELGIFVRMYTMHGLCFVGLVIVFFEALSVRSWGKALLLFAIAVPLFAMAVHLQATTLIGVLGLGAAFVILLIFQFFNWRYAPALLSLIVLAVLAVGTVLLATVLKPDLVGWVYARISFESFAGGASGLWWYTQFFARQYSLAWFLTPVAMVMAIRARRELGIYLSVAFAVIFVLHSIVGASAERYIFYAMPLLFAIWAIAVVSAIPVLQGFIAKRVDLSGLARFNVLGTNTVAMALLGGLLVLSLPLSDAFRRTVNLVRGQSYYIGVTHADWNSVREELKSLADESGFLLTTDFLEAQLYIGRFDMAFSPVIVHDILANEEFAVDPRSGRQAIGSLASLKKVLDQHPKGVIVGDARNLNNRLRINEDVYAFIEARMVKVPLDEDALVFAYRWGED